MQAQIEEEDLFAASAFVLGLGDTQTVAAAFGDLILDCYHKAKSIEQVLHFGSAGIHHCLAAARAHDGKDETAAKELRFRGQAHGDERCLFHVARVERTGNVDFR